MANGGFLYGNANRLVVPAASTSASGYSILDAVDGFPSTYHRSTGNTLTVKWNFGAATAIVGAAIINHNIPVGSTVDVEFSNDDFANILATEHLVAQAADMYLAFSSKSYQYARFNLAVASGYIQAGEYCLYRTKLQPARNYHWGYHRIPRLVRHQSEAGGQITKVNIARQLGFALQFDYMTEVEQDAVFAVLMEKNVLFVPDFSVQECYHGALVDDRVDGAVEKAAAHAFAVNFWQNAIKV